MKYKYDTKAILTLTLFSVFLTLFTSTRLAAQSKNIDHETFYWLRYSPSFDLGSSWSLKGELEIRRWAFPDRQHQLLVPRVTFVKSLSNGWEIGAGGVYFFQSLPQDGEADIDLTRPEIRPHQDLTMRDKVGNVGITHRYRLEERFIRKTEGTELADGYDFNLRFRYRVQFRIPLNDKSGAGALDFKIGDEIMINAGKDIVRNTFDQNRLYVGIRSKFSSKSNLEADLINWFQQRSNGDDFRSRYILRVTFNQSF
ncbi:DUF2490 domain-containing protein [Rhodohalobacter sp. 614A]|uniref:DUF2490 domain-containing protein n=1 Tax=Rhodohalobacter sp. 614A TaxID=2908649 RepID=UPI001F41FE63|nr:DUF2490 domain-containing protein [Rhodohalobacter sp. 614A]